MQTFLPYPSFTRSLSVLDDKRLGKQRVEAWQILRTLTGQSTGWRHHPAVLMWQHHIPALAAYYNTALHTWSSRGFSNIKLQPLPNDPWEYPPWFGDPSFHASHRSNLLRKDPTFYAQFNWTEPPTLEYIWPH